MTPNYEKEKEKSFEQTNKKKTKKINYLNYLKILKCLFFFIQNNDDGMGCERREKGWG